MNYAKKLNLHWFCTQNHILEPFSVRRACTKSYVTSEPYPRASQIWCQNVRETRKKKVIKCRGESFARCRVIARNVEGGLKGPPPPSLFRVNMNMAIVIKAQLASCNKIYWKFVCLKKKISHMWLMQFSTGWLFLFMVALIEKHVDQSKCDGWGEQNWILQTWYKVFPIILVDKNKLVIHSTWWQ